MKPFLFKNGYQIFLCPACGLKATDLREEYESFIRKFYIKGYYTGDPKYAAYASYHSDKWHIVRNMRKFLMHIQKYKKTGKLLDVGCAMGFMVELALKAGYDAYGFDPSVYAVTEGRRDTDGRIIRGTIQSVQYKPKSFDIITLFDVVEHLGDPARDLAKLMTLLKDDGILVMATGNTESMAARTLRRRWTFYIPPQHLFFFTRKNFTDLMVQSGLEPVEWFMIGKWLSLRYVLHLARSTGGSALARRFFRLVEKVGLGWLPLYLPMRDNMVVVAQKSR
ncbi:class I SAM-dependent methyltransferase [Patescibacteria group bacterium]|nr:class I SAM-dependent methyltransferase [Patescibacteria group bacterium]